MIVLDEKIVALWYLSTILNGQDWLAAVRELVPDEKYELTYRFRYYNGDQSKNPFEDGDKKNWYRGELSGTRAYVLSCIRVMAKEMEKWASGGPLYELVNDKGLDDLTRRLSDMPFTYMRRESMTPK